MRRIRDERLLHLYSSADRVLRQIDVGNCATKAVPSVVSENAVADRPRCNALQMRVDRGRRLVAARIHVGAVAGHQLLTNPLGRVGRGDVEIALVHRGGIR